MADIGFFEGIVRNLTGNGILGGKFQLRLIIQPLIAMILGVRLGVRDAKHGKPPFLAGIVAGLHGRWAMLRGGLRDALIPLCMAFVVDGILQWVILGRVRPAAAVVVGLVLVFFPFVLLRGISNRIWTRGHRGRPHLGGPGHPAASPR